MMTAARVALVDEEDDDGVELEVMCECGRTIVWRLGEPYPHCPACDADNDR